MLRFLNYQDFLKNVSMLASGTALSQVITILIAPLLTRLFMPEDYGFFAIFISIVAILSVLATCRYEMAIILPKQSKEGEEIYLLSVLISFSMSIFIFFIVYFFSENINLIFNFSESAYLIYLIPLFVLFAGIGLSNDFFLNRNKDYSSMSYLKISQSISIAMATLILGYFSFGVHGLILGNLIGMLIFVIAGLFFSKKFFHINLLKINFLRLRMLFKENIDFLRYGTPAGIIGVSAYQSFFIFSGIHFGSYILGLFYLVERIVGLPSSIIGNSFGQVFYQRVSKIKIVESFTEVRNFLVGLTVISILIHLSIYLLLYYFLAPIFGNEWSEAISFIKYFILVGSFSFIFAPLSYLFNYLRIQFANLIWQIVWLISNFIIFIICIFLEMDIHEFMMLYTVKQLVIYSFGIAGILIYIKMVKIG